PTRRGARESLRLKLLEEILDRARRPFPGEPVRTLNALHLASALTARAAIPELAILSLDSSIRKSSLDLGFEVVPPAGTLFTSTNRRSRTVQFFIIAKRARFS